MKLKKLYHFYADYGEAFFDENKKLLAAWHENDARWRSEYMNGLLHALGYELVDAPTFLKAEFVRKIKSRFQGLIADD